MLAKDMYDLRSDLAERGVMFCYSGFMTEQVLTAIGSALRTKLELDKTDRQRAKNLFSVFVEQVQNIIRYSAEREIGDNGDEDSDKELRYGVLSVGREDQRLFVSCGNLIVQKDVDRLRNSLDHIKSLDRKALMKLHKETLRGARPEGSKGAGVGFIDIARQASHGFDFDFMPISDQHSYFCLKAYL